ncbi:MAG: hypothetical protein ACOYXA_03310 [Bacteroidota bacterium]
MKTRTLLTVAAFAAALLISTGTNAQLSVEPQVKVIPTSERGIIKVVYAQPTSHAVDVKFIDNTGVFLTDRIQSHISEKGFIKRYNMARLKGETYTIELSSPEMTVTYQLKESANQKWYAVLTSTTYNHALVAKN